jgi:hypothetical protein
VADRARALAKGVLWLAADDPLILDLDGDGIETVGVAASGVAFDIDGDGMAERMGWLAPDDGFLARDADGDGRIGSGAELFGGPGRSGLEALAGEVPMHACVDAGNMSV